MRLTGAFEFGAAGCCCLCCCCCWLLVTQCVGVGVGSSARSDSVAPRPRYLVYPPPGGSATKVQLIFGLGIPMEVDVSTIVGYVVKCNYNLPYNASYPYERYERRERSSDASSGVVAQRALRADIYRMIEAAISTGGHSLEGKPCLLRIICEAAATPFQPRQGLLAQLLHTLLTPSSTAEPIDQQYLAAERIGIAVSASASDCAHVFAECRANFFDYFSEIIH